MKSAFVVKLIPSRSSTSNQETRQCLAPSSRVARDGPCIFTRDQKLRRTEIIRSQERLSRLSW